MMIEELAHHVDDFVEMTVDIDDCPLAELPLTEIYNVATLSLNDDYLTILRTYIEQQLDDTSWLDDQSLSPLFDAGFRTLHRKVNGSIVSLRKASFQRLIEQTLRNRISADAPISIPILIRFMVRDGALPLRGATATVPSEIGGTGTTPTGGTIDDVGPAEEDSDEQQPPTADGEVSQLESPTRGIDPRAPGILDSPSGGPSNPSRLRATFRGIPVDVLPVIRERLEEASRSQTRAGSGDERRNPRERLDFDHEGDTPRTQYTQRSNRTHTSHADLTYGAETFQDYMQQFMSTEVKYKDFRKTTIHKYDSSKQDSFIHWYKLFCATCLQWGIWCPPYESVIEDDIHGCWWTLLPASVRSNDAFMSSLLYFALSTETVFPAGSREHGAVQGCPPNAGYHAIYAILRLHHPRLQTVINTVTEIPRQRRAEAFSSYLRRLHDFLARERIAGRNYSEYEALDLSVRNLTSEWRNEFRRLVERDRRTGRYDDTLPFHLTMAQLATTFVQYAGELGRSLDTPSASTPRDRFSSPSAVMVRRIEEPAVDDTSQLGTGDPPLGHDEIELLVRAMSIDQSNSATCLGCRQPGHTLVDCNRFVDYIVAEGLAQRHPQLRTQVANAHSQFRSRLNLRRDVASLRGSPSPGGLSTTVRSILSDSCSPSIESIQLDLPSAAAPSERGSAPTDPSDGPYGYQVNALRHTSTLTPLEDDLDEFEDCFANLRLNPCSTPVASNKLTSETVSAVTVPFTDDNTGNVCLQDTNRFLLKRLAETYDATSRSVFAHADNGSMACTASDMTLLYAYRPLIASSPHGKVRLFDAGGHGHRPTGVGYLRIPAYRLPPLDDIPEAPTVSCSLFVRTYHTASIPGVIVSHSAISKQLKTNGYTTANYDDRPGFIRFPTLSVVTATATDVYLRIQPTSCRGGLTFTEALIIPSVDEHVAPLPVPVTLPDRYVLCSVRVTPGTPCWTFPTEVDISPASLPALPTLQPALPEFGEPDNVVDPPLDLVVRALSRPALRLLWHQRLGHVNFRRLADMHRHSSGIPVFSVPDAATENCSVCLASKLRKAPRGHGNTMTATQCMQGLGIDFAFMVQRSRDPKRFENLVGFNGETCYVLLTDHYSGRIFGRAFATKAPPVDWLNQWLANNSPSCQDKYVRMDGGGELGKCREIHETFNNFGYQVQLTGPDSSHQNGPGERPHQTIGDALRAMLTGADLRPNFWPYAFYHYVRLYNFMPHGGRASSPLVICGGKLPDLSKLRTFGCRVHVRPTTARYGRVVPNSRIGIFLGYSRTLSVLYYYDVESSLVKTATHARFDEGMNDLSEVPPHVDALRRLSPDGSAPALERPQLSPLNLSVTDDPFSRLDSVTQPIRCSHPHLGFIITACHIRKRGYLSAVAPGSSASYIRNVRRRFIGAFVVSVNGLAVFTCDSILAALAAVAASDDTCFTIVFAPERYLPVHLRPNDSPIHLSVDQLRVIHAIRTHSSAFCCPIPEAPEAPAPTPCESVTFDHITLVMSSLNATVHGTGSLNATVHGTAAEQALGSFTRRKLKLLDNWPDWLAAEAKQLDSMAKQEMYGAPVHPPPGAIILRQHWNYSIKSDGTRKARNCCDGSPRAAPELKLANTYSSCIDHHCLRLFFALCAHENYICIKVDATNAYANSPPPSQPTFVFIDQQYADWFVMRTGHPIERDLVLPVQHALQGHPESGALWESFINKVLTKYGFASTTHERSLYVGTYNGFKMLISRQVDDLAIGCANVASIKKLVTLICLEDKIDLRDEGILDSFNGIDVHQTADYINITCESYIDKLLTHYGWASAGTRESSEKPIEPIAMSTIPQLFADYDSMATADQPTLLSFEIIAGFSYRSVLGAVIYVYVVARPDIGFAVTLLARFSDHPAKVHFDSLRRLARYLRMTKNWGLFYWRLKPNPSLPAGTFVVLIPDPSLPDFPQPQGSTTLAGYVDAAHATDLTTRRSITGLSFMLCGGPIAYKSKVQSTVSTSSTEAEFIAAVQAAKIAKYLRSILSELGYAQPGPTVLYEDNQAAILMINASRPTPRARHIDIQHFAIQEWKAQGDIILCHIPGIINPADALTKSLGPTLHFRHVRRLMGHYGAPWIAAPPTDG
jgi:Reverse transcriptase (RNA-dependent DNA polymerase)/GAG-pre-integrase domain